MKVSFYLRKEKISKDGNMPIALFISGDGVVFRKNVKGVKCKLSDWDSKKERIKPCKKDEEYNFHIEFNKKIDEVENEIKVLFRYLLLNNMTLSKDIIVQKLETNSSALRIAPEFLKVFDEFIDVNKLVKADRTIISYITFKNFLIDFKNQMNYELEFNTINKEFLNSFIYYCINVRGIKETYITKHLDILVVFLEWAYDNNLHNQSEYLRFRRKFLDFKNKKN